jgi:putative drug exporter of the RND superfamily
VAGLTVAGGTISLLAATFHVFRGLGPALALTVLVGLAVCLTLAPAVMTILGWHLFTVLPVRGSQSRNGFIRVRARRRRHLGLALLTRRLAALLVVIAVGCGLALAAVPLTDARLDLSLLPPCRKTTASPKARTYWPWPASVALVPRQRSW